VKKLSRFDDLEFTKAWPKTRKFLPLK